MMNKSIIVGSTALHLNQLKKAPPKTDYDVWVTSLDEFNSNKNHAHQSTSKVDASEMTENVMNAFSNTSKLFGVATNDDLYTIKMSHLGYDIFWWKHVQSMLFMQEKLGAVLNDDLYRELKNHWKEIHTSSRLSLYKSKSEFFDDAVTKHYEHDYLHELVAYPNAPIYKSALKDGEEVLIDNKKCATMEKQTRIDMFREEVTVIALERCIIPSVTKTNDYDVMKSWNYALQKTVTALTKGESQEFMIFNLKGFLKPNVKGIEQALKMLNLL